MHRVGYRGLSFWQRGLSRGPSEALPCEPLCAKCCGPSGLEALPNPHDVQAWHKVPLCAYVGKQARPHLPACSLSTGMLQAATQQAPRPPACA